MPRQSRNRKEDLNKDNGTSAGNGQCRNEGNITTRLSLRTVHSEIQRRANLRARDFQVLADFPSGEIDNFAMTRHGGYFLCAAIDVDGMVGAFAQKLTAMTFEMPD